MLERIQELEALRDKDTIKKIALPKNVIDMVNPSVFYKKNQKLEKNRERF